MHCYQEAAGTALDILYMAFCLPNVACANHGIVTLLEQPGIYAINLISIDVRWNDSDFINIFLS